jgi:GT2 family glycosyltransferase
MVLALPVLPPTSTRLALARPRRRRSPLPTLRTPRLSVIIVNYCLWEDTVKLVRELLASPAAQRGDVEVVVVDNHSPAHPLAHRLRRWPGVSLRRWGRNRGFARAVNEGCRLSRGQWLLLLNPDITVTPSFLEGVLALADQLTTEEPRAGVIGFKLRNSDGSRQLSSGPFPTLVQTLAGLALPRERRKYHYVASRRRQRVPWVTGCCMMVQRTCLAELGGLDRDFFLYYEDVDLCRRAREKGWSVWYEPTLRVIHHHPLHLRPVPAYFRLLTRHALLTYASKHWPCWQFRILAVIVQYEAKVRRLWAKCRRDPAAASLFGKLSRIAADLGRAQFGRARRRLERVVQREEHRRVD